MAELSLTPLSYKPLRYGAGLALTVLLAAAALWLARQSAMMAIGLGALTLAMLTGIIAGNTFYGRLALGCDTGVQFAKQRLLRIGIVLYGFRLTFQQIADIGLGGMLTDLLTLSSTFMLACWFGRRVLRLDRDTVWLIGAGSSICGAAAIMATEPVIKAESQKVAVAVATVVLFGTLGIFLYPLLWHEASRLLPAITPTQWGIFTGSTLHEVAQVVAAGHTVGPEAENAAVIAKMLRVMMLAPFLLLLGRRASKSGNVAVSFPWFALGFIGVALFNSLHLLPQPLVAALNELDNFLLAVAMVALGLTTRFSMLKKAGIKPLLLGLLLFIWLLAGGGAINLAIQHLLA
ncbi:YeiH family putative sulfate export transporter [Kalamiella sp. sgz302252]|uniref:YeiH family putative sulfate export transporter n=1 Tax=Pantoea sp. sgz302252 TaxID=3341827 RepID=UPI0036D32D0A